MKAWLTWVPDGTIMFVWAETPGKARMAHIRDGFDDCEIIDVRVRRAPKLDDLDGQEPQDEAWFQAAFDVRKPLCHHCGMVPAVATVHDEEKANYYCSPECYDKAWGG